MTTTDQPSTPPPSLPDYVTSPNAVFADTDVQWRYGKAPDYTKTRTVWAEGKSKSHPPGSLEEIVENLVKNWEVEASFKPRLSDWRTIDHENYSFAMGGGPPLSAQHMINVGTYNGIIAPNEYYSPENSDFASSHKTFKRMMPTFAWEVLEVYSGPPKVSFRWRHWGVMKSDYVGFNDKGEKVTAKAHGGTIDIEGVTVAQVDEKLRLQAIQTWMDPLEMFRQIAPKGIVNRQVMDRSVERERALDEDGEVKDGDVDGETPGEPGAAKEALDASTTNGSAEQQVMDGGEVQFPQDDPKHADLPTDNMTTPMVEEATMKSGAMTAGFDIAEPVKTSEEEQLTDESKSSLPDKPEEEAFHDAHESIYSSAVTGTHYEDLLKPSNPSDVSTATGTHDAVDEYLESSADQVYPHPKDVEEQVQPVAGEAVVAAPDSEETRMTHEEMGRMSSSECPFLMNRE